MVKLRKRRPVPNHKLSDDLIARGYSLVAGVDEVGRGCWAGPVTAAAVILRPETKIRGVRDSKLLTPEYRQKMAPKIKRSALAVGIGWSSPEEIDRFGLTWAVRMSGIRALQDLSHHFDAVILDGNHNYLKEHCYAEVKIKADQTCLNVACASVIAKVARDRYMALMSRLYPDFGFAEHKGYGTPFHRQAVRSGLSPLHRRLFRPVMSAASQTQEVQFMEMIGANVD